MLYDSLHLAVAIARPADEVYEFVRDPARMPQWAAGLSGSMEQVEAEWWAESPMGRVKVEFVPTNEFGVADHTVTLPDGTAQLNPLRVLANGQGSEVVFTLFRQPGMSEQQFSQDSEMVRSDLNRLKRILESG